MSDTAATTTIKSPLLAALLSYLQARWSEPETKASVMGAISVTSAALLAHWNLIPKGAATPSLSTMYTTDIVCAVTAVFPGPLSTEILNALKGKYPHA